MLTAADLENYTVKVRSPIEAQYRGWRVISMPPPSSGGVVLGQVLGVLEKDDIASLGHNSAAMIHRVAEALKHGFSDRAAAWETRIGSMSRPHSFCPRPGLVRRFMTTSTRAHPPAGALWHGCTYGHRWGDSAHLRAGQRWPWRVPR